MRNLSAMLVLGLLVACAAPAPPELVQNYRGEARPDVALTDQVLAATHAYWATLSSGRWREGYEFFTLDYQDRHGFDEWRNSRQTDWPVSPRAVAIRWTQRAQRSHGPELYAILTWTARKGAIGPSGTLIWRQEPDGQFLLENARAGG